MATPNPGSLDEFFVKLEANHKARQQSKLTRINVVETSGVAHPAHLTEGWVVLKSAGADHQHRTDADYLAGMALATARELLKSDTVPTGGEKSFVGDPNRFLGRSNCGCLYLRTPETMEKSAAAAYFDGVNKAAPKRTWTQEEAAYLTAEANKLLGRDK